MAPRVWPFRYELLDGLRGLAALAVVAHHLGFAQLGPFAVMMFFVISGYCIAAAAEQCRRNACTFGAFMRRRVRRIYPPYLLAIGFYVLTRLLKTGTGGHNDLVRPWLDWVQNLTLTQWVSLLLHPVANAPQNPTLMVAAFWSLCYEEQFYLVMALAVLLAVRRRVPIPLVVLLLAGAGLMWNIAWPRGWVTGFFLEYWVHFATGAALFYVLCMDCGRAARGAFVATLAVLGLVSLSHVIHMLPWHDDDWLRERAYVELSVVCSFALLLFFARPVSPAVSRHGLWKPVAALGTISYSLYLVHQFNLRIVQSLANWMVPGHWEPARFSAMVLLEIGIASAFWYLCERPFLNRAPPRTGKAGGVRGSGEPVPAAKPVGQDAPRLSRRINNPAGC
ncbi:MAG: hypothetical protein PVSMB6_21030 [Steroidobacteraceae bacterium]